MTEEENTESAAADATFADETETGTEIRDTDIVFDCPHCGHNLAIDYRGAGLQINCVNCGETVLVPIPDGMKIDDLDIEPGEILKQLFATRRNMRRCEIQVETVKAELEEMTLRRDTLAAAYETLKTQLSELRAILRGQAENQEKAVILVEQMTNDLANDLLIPAGEDGESVK